MNQSTADVLVRRGVAVPMRDGVVLRADLFLPADDAAPRPALLQRTPYDRTSSLAALATPGLEPAVAIDRGFAVVVQDVRGCFGSEGNFRPFEQEGDDGEDTIAWVAAQPWCDGRVVTWGASYVGATQLLAAVRRPPALRAVIPWMTADDYFDGWTHRGGALAHGFVVRWLLNALAANQLGRLRRDSPAEMPRNHSRPAPTGAPLEQPGPAAADALRGQPSPAPTGGELARLRHEAPALAAGVADAFDALADDHEAALTLTPEAFADAVAPLAPYLRDWLAHPTRDAWWQATSIRDRAHEIAVPALHLGGWFDIFLPGTLANYTRLREHAAIEEARRGQRLIVGPWTHAARGEAVGELLLGRRAARAWLEPTTLQLDFAAAILRGEDPPGPPVRLWTLGANRWRDEDAWPPARMREEKWFLGAADPLDGGTLAPAPPTDGAAPSAFVHDPADPVPTIAGATMQQGDELCFVSGPRDRRAVQARADVLTFTTASFDRPTELTGPVRAVLWIATDAPAVDVVATLSWVEPDGRALHLTDGVLRTSFRDGPQGGAPPLHPGEPTRIEVDLDPISIQLAPGTRLRLELAGACAPRFAPHPDLTRPTRVEVRHEAAHPSHVVLPIC